MRNPFEAFLSEFNRIGSGPKQFASKATLESPKFQEYIKEAVKAYPRFLPKRYRPNVWKEVIFTAVIK